MAFRYRRKQLSSRFESQRIVALEALSRLTMAHVNAPSRKVACQLGKALQDESPQVRECAVALVGPPQDAIVSMEALLGALSAAEEELERLLKEGKKLEQKKAQRPRGEEAKELGREIRSHLAARASHLAWRRTILSRLALFADDRVVEALCELVRPAIAAPARARSLDDTRDKFAALREADERLPHAVDVNAALVRLGNREAVRTVIASLLVLQDEISEWEQWDSFQHIAKPVHRGLTEARARSLEEVAAALTERSPGQPLPERLTVPMLIAWLQGNIALFPERLPGVNSPAW